MRLFLFQVECGSKPKPLMESEKRRRSSPCTQFGTIGYTGFTSKSAFFPRLAWAIALLWSISQSVASAEAQSAETNLTAVVQTNCALLPSGTNSQSTPQTNALSTSGDNMPAEAMSAAELEHQFRTKLELARHYRHIRQPREAEPVLIDLLGGSSSESIKQQALLELAMAAREAGDLPR